MKKKILGLMMALVLCVLVMPMIGLASESDEKVAQVGETLYTSVQEAVNAAASSSSSEKAVEVRLLKDVEVAAAVTLPKDANIILDLYGHTLSRTGETYNDSVIQVGNYDPNGASSYDGKLTIKDSSEAHEGKVAATNGTAVFVKASNDSRSAFTLESGKICAEGAGERLRTALYVANGAYINLKGGTIYAEAESQPQQGRIVCPVYVHPINQYCNVVVNLEGTALIAQAKSSAKNHAIGVNIDERHSEVNVKSGTIKATSAEGSARLFTSSGDDNEINISGGNLTATGKTASQAFYGVGKMNITGGTVPGSYYVKGGGSVNISGGTVEGDFSLVEQNAAVIISNGIVTGNFTTVAKNASVAISGGKVTGTFSNVNTAATVKLTGGTFSTPLDTLKKYIVPGWKDVEDSENEGYNKVVMGNVDTMKPDQAALSIHPTHEAMVLTAEKQSETETEVKKYAPFATAKFGKTNTSGNIQRLIIALGAEGSDKYCVWLERADQATDWTVGYGASLEALNTDAKNGGHYAVLGQAKYHDHSFSYAATDSTITATCDDTDGNCTLTNKQVSITLNAENATYTGASYTGASLDNEKKTAWEAAGLTAPTIKYVGRAGTSYTESETAPTDVGQYTAKITVEGKTATKDFEITKATPTLSNLSATAITYGQNLSNSTISGTAKLGETTVNGTWNWKDGTTAPAVSDSNNTEYEVTFTPTDTNNYNIATGNVKLTVNKADYAGTKTAAANLKAKVNSEAEVTLPELPQGGLYGTATSNNSKVTAGTVDEDRKIKLTVNTALVKGTDNAFDVTVPVTGCANYNDYSVTITVTPVYKDVLTISAEADSFTYGENKSGYKNVSVQENKVAVNALTKTYYTSNDTLLATKPVNAGSYKVVLAIPENNENYEGSKTVEYSIAKSKVTVPTAKTDLVYDRTEQTGINDPASDALYTITGTKKATNAGSDYSATAALKDKNNYEWEGKSSSEDQTINWSIGKATPAAGDFAFTSPTELTYDGNAKNATVAVNSGITGMGNVTVKYYQGETEVTAKNAGDYTVKIDVTAGDNYTEATGLTKDDWKFTIAKATMTVSGTEYDKPYDGAAHGDAATPSVTVGTTVKYSTDGGTNWSTDVPQIKDVGEVTVKVKAENANYIDKTCEYKLKVTKRPITLTSASDTKVYDGSALTKKTDPTVSGGSFAGEESVTYTFTGTQTKAGESDNSFTCNWNETTKESNYAVTKNFGKLRVTPKQLSISTDADKKTTVSDKVYDGKTDATATIGTVLGKVEGDDVQVEVESAAFASKDVGERTVTVSYKLSGADEGNYSKPADASISAKITQKAVTVTAKDASKTYGAQDPELTAKVEGAVEGEDVAVIVKRAEGEAVGVYSITPSVEHEENYPNYQLTFVSGTFTINAPKDAPAKVDTTALSKIKEQYQSMPGYADKKIVVEMQVSNDAVKTEEVAKIQTKTGNKKLVAFDASLVVQVGGQTISGAGDTNNELIATTYQFDFSKKANIQVYRVHNAVVEELTETRNSNGEFVKYDKVAGTITVTACKYSTYAFAYDEVEEVKSTAVNTGLTGNNTTTYIAVGLILLAVIAFVGYMVWKKKRAKQDA